MKYPIIKLLIIYINIDVDVDLYWIHIEYILCTNFQKEIQALAHESSKVNQKELNVSG